MNNWKSVEAIDENIKQLIQKVGIEACENESVSKIKVFISKYLKEILDKADTIKMHSKKQQPEIDIEDIKLAIEIHNENIFNKPLNQDIVRDLARRRNMEPIPALSKSSTLHEKLPESRLTEPNF